MHIRACRGRGGDNIRRPGMTGPGTWASMHLVHQEDEPGSAPGPACTGFGRKVQRGRGTRTGPARAGLTRKASQAGWYGEAASWGEAQSCTQVPFQQGRSSATCARAALPRSRLPPPMPSLYSAAPQSMRHLPSQPQAALPPSLCLYPAAVVAQQCGTEHATLLQCYSTLRRAPKYQHSASSNSPTYGARPLGPSLRWDAVRNVP